MQSLSKDYSKELKRKAKTNQKFSLHKVFFGKKSQLLVPEEEINIIKTKDVCDSLLTHLKDHWNIAGQADLSKDKLTYTIQLGLPNEEMVKIESYALLYNSLKTELGEDNANALIMLLQPEVQLVFVRQVGSTGATIKEIRISVDTIIYIYIELTMAVERVLADYEISLKLNFANTKITLKNLDEARMKPLQVTVNSDQDVSHSERRFIYSVVSGGCCGTESEDVVDSSGIKGRKLKCNACNEEGIMSTVSLLAGQDTVSDDMFQV